MSQSRSGTVSGEIYLKVNDHAFPEIGWNDLVLPVLNGYVRSMQDFIAGSNRQERVHFMDGPFHVDFEEANGETLIVSLSDDRQQNASVRYTTLVGPFVRTILDAADRVIDECRRRAWDNPEIQELQMLRAELRASYDRR